MAGNAFDYLEMRTEADKKRYLAEMREKALKNRNSELAAAERRGIEESAKKAARALLEMGVLSIEQIAEATELSIEQINGLMKK